VRVRVGDTLRYPLPRAFVPFGTDGGQYYLTYTVTPVMLAEVLQARLQTPARRRRRPQVSRMKRS